MTRSPDGAPRDDHDPEGSSEASTRYRRAFSDLLEFAGVGIAAITVLTIGVAGAEAGNPLAVGVAGVLLAVLWLLIATV